MQKRALELFIARERGVCVPPIITDLPFGVGGHVAGSGCNGLGLQDGYERALELSQGPSRGPFLGSSFTATPPLGGVASGAPTLYVGGQL